MNGEIDSDHLHAEVTQAGELRVEPAYVNFLRSNGYTIDHLDELQSVQRGKDKSAHLVMRIATYDLPKDHPNLDYAQDRISLWVCDCADFRYRKAADVSDGEKPSESEACVHIRSASKVENAKADAAQERLV